MLAGIQPDGVLRRLPGLFGGHPGGPVHGVLMDASGRLIEDYGCGALVTLTRTDQVLELQLAGGAGYISAEAATRDHGAVLTPDGRLALAATAALRAERAAHLPTAPGLPA